MSFRRLLSKSAESLHPGYVRPAAGGRFHFSVPVLRVRDIAVTVAWYRRNLGFAAETFPERAPYEFAMIERDGVQLLVRQSRGDAPARDGHAGWDLYLWADGLDLRRLEAAFALAGGSQIVRPLSPMGASVAELEIRDPDGYVLCIGGPTVAAASPITDA
jgi:catechol 2,3-dioxygenase-like lactoylglutathione lyase family enzyme